MNGDTVNTSMGADVPAEHARRAWPLLLKARERVNGELVPVSITVGHFKIEQLNRDGILAGYHRITWAEVERMAGLLGLV